MKLIKYILGFLSLLLCMGVAYGTYWFATPYRADDFAREALTSDYAVNVTTENLLVFEPTNEPLETGIIFYPGGRVEPQAYAPLAHSLSQFGYLTVITPMPLNLAVLDANRADFVKSKFPDIKRWVIAGHSLGGSMAAKYVAESNSENSGLIMLAAYPDSRNNLSSKQLPVLSIYGSEDKVLNRTTFENARKLLPTDTQFVEIAGGNHAQMGSYGKQEGDGEASITVHDQTYQVFTAILGFLTQIP